MNQNADDVSDNWKLLRDAAILRAIMDMLNLSPEWWDHTTISWELRTGEMDWLFEGYPYGGAVFYKKLKAMPDAAKLQLRETLESLMGDYL